MKAKGKPVIAIDFDYTIVNSSTQAPLDGVKEAINLLREKGWVVVIHSCNNPTYIEQWLGNHDIRFDSIWNEKGKPVATCYLDDRGLRFEGWTKALEDIDTYYG